jgi:hypothetical protein
MKKLSESVLRHYIRCFLKEAYASNIDGPHVSNVMSTHLAQRDEIPYLGKKRKKEEDEISAHLMEPEADMEDCYGPVPPTAEEPGVFIDPYTTNWHVTPKADHRR